VALLAGAEVELPWSMPGMDVPVDPGPVPVEHPARAMAAAMAVAERVRNFVFMENQVLQNISGRKGAAGRGCGIKGCGGRARSGRVGRSARRKR
jgi:hypothetical protein